jgi:hypothetical protein
VDGLALGGLENSGGGAGEGTITRVSDSAGCLDGEEALAFEGQVERIAGGSNLSLAEIESVSA